MADEPQRVIVIDEDLDPEFANQLMLRGRHSGSVLSLNLIGRKDAELIAELTELYDDWVLVSANRNMPKECPETIAQYKPTLAFVSSEALQGRRQQERRCDVVHKWAHIFQTQARGSLKVYTTAGGVAWTWISKGKAPKSPGKAVPPQRF